MVFFSTPRNLSFTGLVLVLLFLSIAAGALFSIAILAPAWQLRVGAALINSAPLPLYGPGHPAPGGLSG
jgi:hypothetical protein